MRDGRAPRVITPQSRTELLRPPPANHAPDSGPRCCTNASVPVPPPSCNPQECCRCGACHQGLPLECTPSCQWRHWSQCRCPCMWCKPKQCRASSPPTRPAPERELDDTSSRVRDVRAESSGGIVPIYTYVQRTWEGGRGTGQAVKHSLLRAARMRERSPHAAVPAASGAKPPACAPPSSARPHLLPALALLRPSTARQAKSPRPCFAMQHVPVNRFS